MNSYPITRSLDEAIAELGINSIPANQDIIIGDLSETFFTGGGCEHNRISMAQPVNISVCAALTGMQATR